MLVVTFQAGFYILDGADIKGVVFKVFKDINIVHCHDPKNKKGPTD